MRCQVLRRGKSEPFLIYTTLDALRDIAGFRIKDEPYLRVLQDEGEV